MFAMSEKKIICQRNHTYQTSGHLPTKVTSDTDFKDKPAVQCDAQLCK